MRALILTLPLALSACGDDGLADQLAREQARNAINPVLAERFPGVPLEPATNCIINEASASEILRLAKAGTVGLTPEDTQLVIEIATRPDSIACLTNALTSGALLKLGSKNNHFLSEDYHVMLQTMERPPKAANGLAASGGTAA